MPAQAATGQQYGKAGAQLAAQKALPVSRPATDAMPGPRPTGPGRPPVPTAMPGQMTPLDAPTARPNEPITAGLPVGPGAGPEALGPLGMGGEDVGMELRAIYARYPNEELRTLIEMLDDDD